jgi:hypothetical protein
LATAVKAYVVLQTGDTNWDHHLQAIVGEKLSTPVIVSLVDDKGNLCDMSSKANGRFSNAAQLTQCLTALDPATNLIVVLKSDQVKVRVSVFSLLLCETITVVRL